MRKAVPGTYGQRAGVRVPSGLRWLHRGRPLGTDEGNGWEVFADGFIGKDSIKSPTEAAYRPTGLAEGPGGALYLTEDKTGRIWRITYAGQP